MPRVRLEDVARHVGVSMKTVSNVVHDYPHVSAAMRERVQRGIDELGYRPNAMGRRLATGRTGMLALAFGDVSLPYFAELARTVSLLAADRGYRLLLEQTDGSLEGERAILARDEAGLVDGVIFQPSAMSTLELAQRREDVPFVLLGEGAAPLAVDHVMIDNVAAARDITSHVIALGRGRIAFVGHELGGLSATSRMRLEGYQDALERAGLRADASLLIPTAAVSAAAAAQAVGDAVDAGLDVDALVCHDDLAALGALRALAERGIDVPGRIAVTGWDDADFAPFLRPSLTTVHADTETLARTALDRLEQRIGGYDGIGRHELVGYRIEARESAPGAAA